jgi:hypothetical protein
MSNERDIIERAEEVANEYEASKDEIGTGSNFEIDSKDFDRSRFKEPCKSCFYFGNPGGNWLTCDLEKKPEQIMKRGFCGRHEPITEDDIRRFKEIRESRSNRPSVDSEVLTGMFPNLSPDLE